ncbi:Carrier protein, mitochondrial [Coniosporium apollinis]|uniref:Carrier protein, mitochondrial n=1 Tax=Coniosporium apollinis TaxID=61459 RepID=A0ABQ9NV08_9PEZI|nr:Carrier protein, mitochondrial [Coniosporium apollinis]
MSYPADMKEGSAPASDDGRGLQENSGQRHDRIAIKQRHIAMASAEIEDDSEDLDVPDQVSISQKMLSAVSGSILTSLLVTPLDVVRVRLQSQAHPSDASQPRPHIRTLPSTLGTTSFSNLPPNLGISSCCREVFWVNNNAPYCVAADSVAIASTPASSLAADCAAEEAQRKTFTSTFDGLRKIAQNEGTRTLWRGLSPTLVMAVPANVIYFAGYDWLRTSPASPLHNNISPVYAPLAAGSTARILAAVAVSPIEMFRTRMQAAHNAQTASGLFRETLDGLRDMVQAQGFRSLWRGLSLTLWRDVPFSAIYWWGYESGRNVLTDARERARGRSGEIGFLPNGAGDSRERHRRRSRSREKEDHTATLVDSFVAGAVSGAVAAFVTTPFDVGKTRQQVLKHSGAESRSRGVDKKHVRPEDRSMPRFLWHILKEQGMGGLFKGWAARCLKVAPACAIMISSYEIGKKMAGGMNERRDAKRLAVEEEK